MDSIRRKTKRMFGTLCLTLLLAFSASIVIPGQVVEAAERSETLQETSYTLTVNIEGDGTVEIDPDQDEYEEGTEVNLKAIPGDGVDFAYWENAPAQVDDVTEDEIDITMEGNYSITAHFRTPREFSLNVEGNGNVTIEQMIDEEWEEVQESPVEDEISREVWDGVELRLTAIPDALNRLDRWEGAPDDVDETEEQIEITVNEDMDITAHFEEIEFYELTIEIDGIGEVEVTHDRGFDILEDGDSIEITEDTEVDLFANPDVGWEFVEWGGDIGDEDPERQRIYVDMDGDKTITVEFEEEDTGIPGFSMTLLVLAAVVSVAIYQKKKR